MLHYWPLEIDVQDKTTTYNGEEQYGYEVSDLTEGGDETCTVSGLKNGHVLSAPGYEPSSGTNHGEYDNGSFEDPKYTMMYEGYNYDINYEVDADPGDLTITAMKVIAVVKGNKASYIYDGTEKTVSGFEAVVKDSKGNVIDGLDITTVERIPSVSGTKANTYPLVIRQSGLRLIAKSGSGLDPKNYEVITWDITNGELKIDPRNITLKITGKSDTKTYNGEEQSVSGYDYEFTVDNSDGNAFSADNLSVIYRGGSHDTASGTNVGTYDMTMTKDMFDVAVSGGLDRTSIYMDFRDDFTLVNGKLTITPATVTVKADNKSKTQGQADPALTATVTGLFGDDTIEYSLSRETGQAPGTYTITPSGETEQGNYIVVFETGTFTINAAPAPGGGGGPAGGGPAGPVAAVVNPVPAPAAIADEPAPTTINDEPAPKTDNPVWALLNLLCMLATALMSLIMLIRFFVKRKGGARIASLIPAVGAIVAFILTEDMSAQMVMVDKWTIMMVIILAIQAGVAVLANMKKNEDEEEASEA